MQTEDERNKYGLLLRQNFPQQVQRDQLPDFDKFAKIWSTFVDGKPIFYKVPEHLRNYHSKWNDYQNTSKTRKSYKETLEVLEQDLRSPSRKRNIPEARLPAALKIPRIEEIMNDKTSPHQVSSVRE